MVYECEEGYGEVTIQKVSMHKSFDTIEETLKFKELSELEKL